MTGPELFVITEFYSICFKISIDFFLSYRSSRLLPFQEVAEALEVTAYHYHRHQRPQTELQFHLAELPPDVRVRYLQFQRSAAVAVKSSPIDSFFKWRTGIVIFLKESIHTLLKTDSGSQQFEINNSLKIVKPNWVNQVP